MMAYLLSSAKGPQLSLAFSQMLLQLILVIIPDEFDDILSPALHMFLHCERAFSKELGCFQPPASALATPEFSEVLLDTESK